MYHFQIGILPNNGLQPTPLRGAEHASRLVWLSFWLSWCALLGSRRGWNRCR